MGRLVRRSQSLTRSASAAARVCPSGLIARVSKPVPSSLSSCLKVDTRHIMAASLPLLSSVLPSELKAIDWMVAVWPVRGAPSCCPEDSSQILILLSSPVTASVLPSGLKAMPVALTDVGADP
ncbi:hypothetical protein GCM10010412_006060 [Nonomuraea recticatena]|uniref:Uncharacterized protein n=1 Tax=Nonomuraea recticatena TaxID=46178 RepID=A0ABN3R5X7_9ACTN